MRPLATILLAALVLLSGLASDAWACYAIVVGKGVSVDGCVLVGHNEENARDRVLCFHKVPRQQYAPGSVVRLERGGAIEQVPETWAILWSENPGLRFSDGYLNEWGVAVVSDMCQTREDDYDTLVARGEIRDGGIGAMLRRLVAQRAKTAREGMELIGRLVERFGYVDSGRSYVVADPAEAWIVSVVRGRRWVAQRVPDDQVVLLGHRHIIGEIDLTDPARFRASPDLVSYAVRRGWYDPAGGRPFNFRQSYHTPEQAAPLARQFRGQEVVRGQAGTWPPAGPLPFSVAPARKLGVADVAAVLRDDGGIAKLFDKSTQELAVFQLRALQPREIGCVYWRTTGRPDVSVLTPWYVGITSTPERYSRPVAPEVRLSLEHHFDPPAGTFDVDPELAWWKFRTLEGLVDQDYANRFPVVRGAWSSLERRLFKQQAALEAEVMKLWASDPDAARAALTHACAEIAEEACRQADQLSRGFRGKMN